MELRFEASDPRNIRALRAEVVAYLRRHGTDTSDFHGAELVISELLTNVWRHTDGTAWVEVTWSGPRPRLTVRDLGPAFDWQPTAAAADALGGRGLHLVSSLGQNLTITRRRGGAVVSVVLPVDRATSVSIDPPRRRSARLPTLEEAVPGQGFGREAFLRALVVQLASAADGQLGPDVLESLVAQVGIDVGTQMEAEYRAATQHEGPLAAPDLGECFVRLKAAIGGTFRVVDVQADQVVLENDDCPFGSVVQHAPGLCRMTSSVFGGIAARTSGTEAVVSLEERIAVGDPHCRVVVRFGEAAQADAIWGHRYRPSPAHSPGAPPPAR
jgi:anti-sigma regulatory factor (Ser/Thr protein kinase)